MKSWVRAFASRSVPILSFIPQVKSLLLMTRPIPLQGQQQMGWWHCVEKCTMTLGYILMCSMNTSAIKLDCHGITCYIFWHPTDWWYRILSSKALTQTSHLYVERIYCIREPQDHHKGGVGAYMEMGAYSRQYSISTIALSPGFPAFFWGRGYLHYTLHNTRMWIPSLSLFCNETRTLFLMTIMAAILYASCNRYIYPYSPRVGAW